MKKKLICKIVIDMIMTVLLLFLMARQLTGDSAHEWLGTGMLILWITQRRCGLIVEFFRSGYKQLPHFRDDKAAVRSLESARKRLYGRGASLFVPCGSHGCLAEPEEQSDYQELSCNS